MTSKKFKNEIDTLQSFIHTYCSNKHYNQTNLEKNITYRELDFSISLHLCKECEEIFNYSLTKLQMCPHEEKPRCRKCSNPCYEKLQWKHLAKIMRYSGIKLGLLELKNKLFS